MINYSHYQRTATTIDQVYPSGSIERDEDSRKILVPLAWSWVVPPKVSLEREAPSYTKRFYDPTQKAYVFDWKPTSNELSFDLIADSDYYNVCSGSRKTSGSMSVAEVARLPDRKKVK